MKNKRFLALMTALSLTAGLAACGTTTTTTTAIQTESVAAQSETGVKTDTAESAKSEETTVTARVDSVSDNTINVTLGELGGMKGGPGNGQTPPAKPNGEAPSDANGSGQTPPSDANGNSQTPPSGTNDNSQTPPAMPNGEAPSGTNGSSQTPPAKPNGEAPSDANGNSQTPPSDANGNSQTPPSDANDSSQTPPSMPNGAPGGMDISAMFRASDETATYTIDESVLDGITLDQITEGTILTITLDKEGNVTKIAEAKMNGGPGGPGGSGAPGGMGAPGGNSAPSEYSAVTTYAENTETSGETYISTGTDENAVLVDSGASVTIDKADITRTSGDSTGGDSASFYGVGAAVLAKDGTLNIKDTTITTDASGGTGVFAYGDGTVYVEDTTINTTQDTSGGIHAAGGGTLYAWDLNVTTNGGSAAAIRSDRGGGTMVVEGGSYTSNGTGSPAVYTTADITIDDADLTATGSEAVCIEGLNSLRLFDCDLTGNMPENDQNDVTWDVIVYQSMSGDSEIGTGNFSMVGGTLTSKNGGLFYTTNTSSEFLLSDVDINYSDDNDFFLQVTGNTNKRGWGSAGANGAQCNFTCDNQEAAGKIVYDSISTLDFYLTNGSKLTGYFIDDETWAGNGGSGYCNVYVSADSTWVVTESCSIDALYAAGSVVDQDGNKVTVRGEDGKVYVEGTSGICVTVASYSTEDKSADALETPAYSDYKVTKPEKN